MRVKSSERVPRQALQAQNDADVLYAAGSIQEFRTDDANVLLPAEA